MSQDSINVQGEAASAASCDEARVGLASPAEVERTSLVVDARDGQPLSVIRYQCVDQPTVALVIASSLSAPLSLYEDLARFMARAGAAVYTFDYRGKGGSLNKPLRDVRAALHEWGELDLDALLIHASEQHPEARLCCLAHGVGGQLMGLCSRVDQVHRAILVSAGNAHWRHCRGKERLRKAALAYGVVPALTKALGYYPGSRLGGAADLPSEVAREWAQWSRKPSDLFQQPRASLRHFEAFEGELIAYSFTDDVATSVAAVESLLSRYPKARKRHRRVRPFAVRARQIGSEGYFSERFCECFWRDAAAFFIDDAPMA